MSKRLTTRQIEGMFKAYCDRPSCNHVAHTCKVSHATAKKYRNLGHWEERRRDVLAKLEAKTDETIAQMLDRQAEELRGLQIKSLQAALTRAYRDGKDAADVFLRALAEERVIRGQPGEHMEIDIVERIRKRYADRHQA